MPRRCHVEDTSVPSERAMPDDNEFCNDVDFYVVPQNMTWRGQNPTWHLEKSNLAPRKNDVVCHVSTVVGVLCLNHVHGRHHTRHQRVFPDIQDVVEDVSGDV